MKLASHFCKETNKICKNALFLDFLAYLHFVAWLTLEFVKNQNVCSSWLK